MIRHILPQGLGTALLACYGDFRAHQLMLCFVLAGELQATQGAFDFSTAADGFQMARHELTLYCFATNLTLDHRLGADFSLMDMDYSLASVTTEPQHSIYCFGFMLILPVCR
jgi:hypothetical protein